MRRMIALVVVLVAVLTAGCGGTTTGPTVGASNPTTAKDSTTAKATTTEATNPLGQKWGATVTLQGLTIKLTAPVDDTANLSDAQRLFLTKGNKVMYCTALITNTSKETYAYNIMSFTLYDAEGQHYDAFGVVSVPTLGSGDLLPGKTVKGAVGFELPKTSHPSYVQFQRDIMSETESSWGD